MNKYIPIILYVEDEDGIKDELGLFLKRITDKLYFASNGEEGLELYKKCKPDLVISDIKMPKMDGLSMVNEIKKINPTQYVIFTTAFNDADFFINAIELQVYAYILKPINLKKLEVKINEVISNIELKNELKLKEQMLIQQSKMAAMGEMIGNIAHHWRQPLSIISTCSTGMITLKENEILTDELFFQNCENINKNVQYLSETIDDFRDFFKNYEANENDTNIKSFLEKSIDLTSASFHDHEVIIIKQIDENINVFGNKHELIQAIINILNNAKDAFEHSLKSKKYVFIFTLNINNDFVEISIKDNAGGIPDEIIDRIFEPYFTTKHKTKGTGLGLYITYQIITQNLKDTIFVKNEEFEYENEKFIGVNFIIKLPISKRDNIINAE